MQAGTLRHLITIQRAIESQDDFGGIVKTWENWFQTWGKIQPLSGKEIAQQQQLMSTTTHSIWLRFNTQTAQITVKDRITYQNQIHRIESIINVQQRNQQLKLMTQIYD